MAETGTASNRIVPVILSGGTGTRLWPLSRAGYPKQFLPLTTELTLIQETVERVRNHALFDTPIIVSNDEHRFIVAEQLRERGLESPTILLEPCVRNTAPALAAAALYLRGNGGENALMLVMPSDHIISQPDRFTEAVQKAAPLAEGGYLVTFGVTPEYAETGYGYIQTGTLPDTKTAGVYALSRFVEKPDAKTAAHYIASEEYLWNSGIFLFSVKAYLEELERLQPLIVETCAEAVKNHARDLDFVRLENISFFRSPSLSIDYAVMEHTKKGAVVALDCGWSDAGSWESLWNIARKDTDGNALVGDVCAVSTRDCYIRAEGVSVSTFGIEDLVVVSTKDAVLVASKKASQDIKKLVEQVRAKRPELVETHRRVYRPWGYYETVDDGSRHQVKRINVRPGAKLSLQMHHHRAEHWVVVRGTARVVLDSNYHVLGENQSIYIPLGSKHRIENPGKIALDIIEVQSGAYLGEDDIVRFEDQYGRNDRKPAKSAR